MLVSLILLAYEGGKTAGDLLLDELANRVVDKATAAIGDSAGSLFAQVAPGFLGMTNLGEHIKSLHSNFDGAGSIRDAIKRQATAMDVTLVSNAELQALRNVALVANSQGDMKDALEALAKLL